MPECSSLQNYQKKNTNLKYTPQPLVTVSPSLSHALASLQTRLHGVVKSLGLI